MRNLRFVSQCIDRQSGDDGGSFLGIAFHAAWPHPKASASMLAGALGYSKAKTNHYFTKLEIK